MPADIDFFHNQTERDKFKREYPIAFNYLFEGGYGHRVIFPEITNILIFRKRVKEELEKILAINPSLFNRLSRVGVYQGQFFNPQAYKIAEKRGDSRCGEICFPWQPQGHSENEPSQILAKLIISKLKRYRNSRSKWQQLTDQGELDRANEIEQEINRICDLQFVFNNQKEKIERILTCLDTHFRELCESGSVSYLKFLLEPILRQNSKAYKKGNPYHHTFSGWIADKLNTLANFLKFLGIGIIFGNFFRAIARKILSAPEPEFRFEDLPPPVYQSEPSLNPWRHLNIVPQAPSIPEKKTTLPTTTISPNPAILSSDLDHSFRSDIKTGEDISDDKLSFTTI